MPRGSFKKDQRSDTSFLYQHRPGTLPEDGWWNARDSALGSEPVTAWARRAKNFTPKGLDLSNGSLVGRWDITSASENVPKTGTTSHLQAVAGQNSQRGLPSPPQRQRTRGSGFWFDDKEYDDHYYDPYGRRNGSPASRRSNSTSSARAGGGGEDTSFSARDSPLLAGFAVRPSTLAKDGDTSMRHRRPSPSAERGRPKPSLSASGGKPEGQVQVKAHGRQAEVKPTEVTALSDADLQALRPIFKQFDASGDGYVSTAELGKMVEMMKLEMSQ